MAFGGKGIGKSDGKVFFVRGAVPGDTVVCELVRNKKDLLRAC